MNRADQLAIEQGCYLDLAAAERVRTFFHKFLRHSKGQWAGKPFTLLDWQWEGVIKPLFGWKRPDGTRRFRRGGIWIPKKNGKSALGSGLSLYMLIGDGEPGAEVYNAANDRDQAGIVFNESLNMVKASPALQSILEPVPSVKRIVYPRQNAWLKALSADVPTKEGLNWHFLLFDELHAQTKRDLWDTLAYGGAARRQPLLLSISTAGFDRDSIGYEQYLYAQSVLEGRSEDTAFFGYVAGADKEDDWKSPDVWRKANPSLSVTIQESDMQEACKEAQESPAKENSFRRYRLNQWTDAAARWISSEAWDACGALPLWCEPGGDCYPGIDLADTNDTASLVLVFPHPDESISLLPFIFVPESACKERERKNKQRYDEWARRGHLIKTPGNVIDYQSIRAKLKNLAGVFNVQEVGYDPWNATQFAQQLQDEDGFKVFAVRQGFGSMSEPAKRFDKLVRECKVRHGNHPVLRWMVGNTVVVMDAAGNIKPSKDPKKGATEKIDAVVAAINGLARAMLRPEGGSTYDGKGLELL